MSAVWPRSNKLFFLARIPANIRLLNKIDIQIRWESELRGMARESIRRTHGRDYTPLERAVESTTFKYGACIEI